MRKQTQREMLMNTNSHVKGFQTGNKSCHEQFSSCWDAMTKRHAKRPKACATTVIAKADTN
jgi:hypothetical protein